MKVFLNLHFSVYNTSWGVNARQRNTPSLVLAYILYLVCPCLQYLATTYVCHNTLLSLLPGSPHISNTHICGQADGVKVNLQF